MSQVSHYQTELIKFIEQNVPDNANVSAHATRGMNTDEPGGNFTHAAPNGSMTITIQVGGGAVDTRTQSGFYEAMRGYSSIHEPLE